MTEAADPKYRDGITSARVKICFEIPANFFAVIRQQPVLKYPSVLPSFLGVYEKLVESRNYSWSYAETIATNMKTIFSSEDAPANYRAAALELAIRAVHFMTRFAAMDTCNGMIKAVKDETLGLEVAGLIIKYADTFVSNIESGECASTAVANALRKVRVK